MSLPTLELVFYSLFVASGILGNAMVLLITVSNALKNKTLPASDLILTNLTVVLLLISIFRNALVITYQHGVVMAFNPILCKLYMFAWTLLRSMSIWGTFSVSFFHFISIKNYNIKLRKNATRTAIKALAIIWTFNCLYYIPTFFFTNHKSSNVTFALQLVSTSMRPLYNCVWDFPTLTAYIVFVTGSLVLHEIIPVTLMVVTNIGSLYILQQHSKTIAAQKTLNRVAAERKAALVIFTLVSLFVLCWGSNTVASNYYNYAGSTSSSFLLIIANFGAYTFMGFSPLVLLIGHTKMRQKLIHLLCNSCKRQVSPGSYLPKSNGNIAIVKF